MICYNDNRHNHTLSNLDAINNSSTHVVANINALLNDIECENVGKIYSKALQTLNFLKIFTLNASILLIKISLLYLWSFEFVIKNRSAYEY